MSAAELFIQTERQELIELVEKLSIPVDITLMGLSGFPSAHPLSLGMLGMHGSYAANMAISEADLIIALGVRFDDRVTGNLAKFAPNAEIIHVDIDDSSIDKNVKTHVSMIGNAKDVIAANARFSGKKSRTEKRKIERLVGIDRSVEKSRAAFAMNSIPKLSVRSFYAKKSAV